MLFLINGISATYGQLILENDSILCFIFMMLILLSDISRAILSSNGIIVFMFLGCILIASVVVFLLDIINTLGYRTLKDDNGDAWEIRGLS